ncbi:hypothetical protein JQ633_01880 [Bradyrhizobium tropiciagri]|uniref:hypothetical protein n=1 Tax=Bradyrhizobium tropiciagri TaxID=312253 RepID=UPI001BAC546F|nr:hypothetical protein [Bradyrhizobium tropiciagri]MBR0869090.1 hypothetical protein [Bradyrhizobium tropiciagri]
MKLLSRIVLAVAAYAAATFAAQAQDAVDKARAAAFDKRMFAGPVHEKTYACFVRRYDANHLAQHPKQKVSAMKLLVEAETEPEDKTISYSFRTGVKFRDRAGDFDSVGSCNHALASERGHELRYECNVDCDGGGITVALSKDNKSAIVHIGRIMVSERGKPGDAMPDDAAGEALSGSGDDKIFRVDRADSSECAELVTDRTELAALSHK